jgi:hypothetical protein
MSAFGTNFISDMACDGENDDFTDSKRFFSPKRFRPLLGLLIENLLFDLVPWRINTFKKLKGSLFREP